MTDIVRVGQIPTIYADAFEDHQIVNGTVRCTGFVLTAGDVPGMEPMKVAVVDLIISHAGILESISDAQRALNASQTGTVKIWRGPAKGH